MNDQQYTIVHEFLRSDLFGWIVFGTFVVTLVAIRSLAGVIKTISRERTRREIAAYIAEGSLTPDQGEKLMRAGKSE